MATANVYAQHELNLGYGYGYGTQQQFMKGFGSIPYKMSVETNSNRINDNIADKVFGIGSRATLNDPKYSGAVFFTYRYRILPRLSVGIAAGYERETREVTRGGLQTIGSFKEEAYTLAAEAQFLYKQVSMVQFFCNAGFGNTYVKEQLSNNTYDLSHSDSRNHYAIQLTPFGVSVGKKLSGFAQVGYGYKGLLQMGASLEL